MNYAICEINGKQYKVVPNQPIEVDYLAHDPKEINAKVLMTSDNGKVELGTPYLLQELILTSIETVKKPKIRVAKFHAKANYRRVKGFRRTVSKVVYAVKT